MLLTYNLTERQANRKKDGQQTDSSTVLCLMTVLDEMSSDCFFDITFY